MVENSVKKFLVIVLIAGILGGGIFGFFLALLVLPIFHSFEESLIFTAMSFLLFTPSICIQLWKKNWGIIVRRIFTAVLVGLFFAAMFSLEEGKIPFNEVDWTIIYICLAVVILPFILFLLLSEYYNQSSIYQEIIHIIKGLQLYEILPASEEEKKK